MASSSGEDAIGLAEVAGLKLDPWQKTVMNQSLSERADGKWSAFEVGLVTPRQNGKNSCLEVRELAGLYLFEEELILHSAHEFNTSDEQFMRIKFLIGQSHELSKRVHRVLNGHGAQQIELTATPTLIMGSSGEYVKYSKHPRIKFATRTSGAGRGFTADCIVLDESYRLPRAAISALMPTVSARPNPQIWYASSAVDQEVHEHGVVLTGVRQRGIDKSSPRLYYAEWSADEVEYNKLLAEAKRHGMSWRIAAGSRKLWQQSNPGFGYRPALQDTIDAEIEAMPEKTFKVERLGIGDWPSLDDDASSAIDMKQWRTLVDASSTRDGDCAIGIDIAPNRSYAAIGLYSYGTTGLGHMHLIGYGAGTNWLMERINELRTQVNPLAWGMGLGTYTSLKADLQANKYEKPESIDDFKHGDVLVLNGTMMNGACGHILDAVRDKTMLVKPDENNPEILDDAVAGAVLKEGNDAVAWSRKGKSDITPLVALTCARWAFVSLIDNIKPDQFFGSWR